MSTAASLNFRYGDAIELSLTAPERAYDELVPNNPGLRFRIQDVTTTSDKKVYLTFRVLGYADSFAWMVDKEYGRPETEELMDHADGVLAEALGDEVWESL